MRQYTVTSPEGISQTVQAADPERAINIVLRTLGLQSSAEPPCRKTARTPRWRVRLAGVAHRMPEWLFVLPS